MFNPDLSRSQSSQWCFVVGNPTGSWFLDTTKLAETKLKALPWQRLKNVWGHFIGFGCAACQSPGTQQNYQPTIHQACTNDPMAAHVYNGGQKNGDWSQMIHSGPLLAIVRTQEEGISGPETTMHCFSESVWINAKYYQLPATSCFMQSVKDLLKFWFTGRKTNHAIQSVALSPVFGTILEVFLFTFDSGNLMAIYNTCFFWQNGTGTMTMTMLGRRRALEDVWEDRPAVLLCKGPMCGRITRDLKVCSVILSSEELMLFRLQKIVLWLTRVAGLPSLPPGDRYYGQEAAEVSTGLSTERALCHASALMVHIMRYLS